MAYSLLKDELIEKHIASELSYEVWKSRTEILLEDNNKCYTVNFTPEDAKTIDEIQRFTITVNREIVEEFTYNRETIE